MFALFDEYFSYSPETGELRWRKEPGNGHTHKGDLAGIKHMSGWRVRLKRRHYMAHRVIWMLMTGDWPTKQIDHINGDPFDNRWSNLREADNGENAQNRGGVRGYYRSRGETLWRVKIKINGVSHWIGRFKTKEEARRAYLEAKARLHAFQPAPPGHSPIKRRAQTGSSRAKTDMLHGSRAAENQS